MSNPDCPHGCGEMMSPINGDPLEPKKPYCTECGHIYKNGADGCSICEEKTPIQKLKSYIADKVKCI
jgi:hypothetical protein